MTAEPFSIKALYLFLCICRGSREMNLHQSTIGNYGNYGNYALIIARKCGLINMVIMVMDIPWLYDNDSQESHIFFPFAVMDVLHDTRNFSYLPMIQNLVPH